MKLETNCFQATISMMNATRVNEVLATVRTMDMRLRDRLILGDDMSIYWTISDRLLNDSYHGRQVEVEVHIVQTRPANLFSPLVEDRGAVQGNFYKGLASGSVTIRTVDGIAIHSHKGIGMRIAVDWILERFAMSLPPEAFKPTLADLDETVRQGNIAQFGDASPVR
jgi:hypothetical protein